MIECSDGWLFNYDKLHINDFYINEHMRLINKLLDEFLNCEKYVKDDIWFPVELLPSYKKDILEKVLLLEEYMKTIIWC